MRRRLRTLLAAVTAGVLAGSLAIQPPAMAASANIAGTIDPWGAWEMYTNIRTTSGTVTFQPTNLIVNYTYETLNIKLYEYLPNQGYTGLGSPQLWVNTRERRTLVSGARSGTLFVVAACCRASGDMDWAGNLTW